MTFHSTLRQKSAVETQGAQNGRRTDIPVSMVRDNSLSELEIHCPVVFE